MTFAARKVLRASVLLLILAVGLVGLALSPAAATRLGSGATLAGTPETEPLRITARQADTFAFFNDGRAAIETGRGLFETDFFKPAPPPPRPAPKAAPPPPPRKIAVVYRGFASFPGGAGLAYLAVDERVREVGLGEAVAEGWTLLEYNADQAVLVKDGQRLALPFNRATAIPAAVKP